MTSESAIRVRGLRKTYGGQVAVESLDLDVARGECFALLGPNGAGKTTTVEILEGYRARTGGEPGHAGGSRRGGHDRQLGGPERAGAGLDRDADRRGRQAQCPVRRRRGAGVDGGPADAGRHLPDDDQQGRGGRMTTTTVRAG